MTDTLTCGTVDERDLVTKYVAGRLSEPQEAQLEAHCLTCERCWTELHIALKVRAATEPSSSQAPAIGGTRRSLAWLVPRGPAAWAAAAAILFLVLGGNWLVRRGQDAPDEERGSSAFGTVEVTNRGESVRVTWPAVPGTARYIVSVADSDGRLLDSREVTTTRAEVARAPAGAFVTVEAFSPLGDHLATSTPVQIGNSRK